jgi:hypothetical protein
MKKLSIFVIAILLLFSSCSTIYVKTDFDRDADFSVYKTYSWIPDKNRTQRNKLMEDQLIRKHIYSAVDRELAEMGFEKTDGQRADILVTFYIGTKKKVDVTHYGYGYGRWGGFYNRGVSVHRYKEGTLILDFIDAGDKQLIWRGWASSVFHGRENAAEDIAKSVKRILQEYPPQK